MPQLATIANFPVPSAEPEPTAAVANHLRRIIEKQPCCLLRVAVDGRLLAANDAALGLLGAHEVAQVLASSLITWIVPEHRDLWPEFAATVAGDTARSLECDLTDLSGARRTILFHGVPLLDHPDGIPSLMLGARDASALRRLEASHESERAQHRTTAEQAQLEQLLKVGRTHLEAQRAQLAEAAADRQRLQALLEQHEAEHQRVVAEHAELQRTLATVANEHEHTQHDRQVKEREEQQQLDRLQMEVSEASADRQRLQTLLEQHEAEHQRVVAAHTELQHTLGALANDHELSERDRQAKEQEAQQQLDRLQMEVSEASADRQRLQTLLEQHEAEHQRVVAAHAELQHALGALANDHELSERDWQAKEQEAQQQLDRLQMEVSEASADRQRLQTLLEQQAAAHQHAIADHVELQRTLATLADAHEFAERERQVKEQEAQQQLERLRTEVSEMTAGQQRLENLLEQQAAAHQRVIAEHTHLAKEWATERSHVDGVLATSALKQKQMAQSLADNGVELLYMDLAAKQLAPLAMAGRAALQVGAELQRVAEAIDARVALLLAQCPPDAPHREEIEALRGDAIRAGSLVRQIEHAHAEIATTPSSTNVPVDHDLLTCDPFQV